MSERNPIAPQIIDEASQWFVTMREPDPTTQDREAFADWLRASPVHVAAYLEVGRLWTDASHIDRNLAAGMEGDVPLPANVIALGMDSAHEFVHPFRDEPSREERRSRGGASRRRLLAVAASLLLATMAGGSWLYATRPPAYATDIGEQRTLTLEDGSIVRLDSRSEIRVHLSSRQRDIELVRGRALFEVAHDTARPFIVASGNEAIRAIGTQFDVNRKSSGTTVTVIEGRVRLESVPASPIERLLGTRKVERARQHPDSVQTDGDADESGRRPPESLEANASAGSKGRVSSEGEIYLTAGEQMRIDASGAMEKADNANTAAAISWLQQQLIFEDLPLSDVVEEFNRYTRTPIRITDPALADLRINAVFHTTASDSLLRFISRNVNIRVERSETEIRISRGK